MPISVGEFLDVMERLAPFALAEEWDACGLQVGLRDSQVTSVLVTLDVTGAVIDEAATLGSDLILTHHPLIFRPLSSVSSDDTAGRLVQRAAAAGIAVVAAHTNLDAAPGGLADMMARMIGLVDVEPVTSSSRGSAFKLVVFVPPKDHGPVREALFAAGAGVIGDYRHCSWYVSGTGTFLPQEGAKPAVGEIGIDESVEELRLETIVGADDLEAAVAAMVAAHSYEEPAYDIYPLVTLRQGAPAGRKGELPEAVAMAGLAGGIAGRFGMEKLRYTEPAVDAVKRVAVVPGSGAGFIGTLAGDVDALVTGDIKYHDSQAAGDAGIGLIELPHDVSETTALREWLPILEKELAGTGVEVRMSSSGIFGWKIAAGEAAAVETPARSSGAGKHRLYVDGGARGNPGPAGIGAVLLDGEGDTVAELAAAIGEATNNVAEYRALVAGVEMALERGATDLDIYSDSELIVKQLGGSYKVKNAGLKPLHEQARAALSRLAGYRLTAIRREDNSRADALVNKALDEESC